MELRDKNTDKPLSEQFAESMVEQIETLSKLQVCLTNSNRLIRSVKWNEDSDKTLILEMKNRITFLEERLKEVENQRDDLYRKYVLSDLLSKLKSNSK